MQFKKFLISLLLFLACNNSFAGCGSIDKQVNQLMKKGKVNGVAIAIINKGKTEFCSYGYTSENKKHKINEHTVFEIASISKTFTATLAGIAVAQGLFDLKKPISDYVKALDVNPDYRKVNSQELLTHVSGLKFTNETDFSQSNQSDFINTLIENKAQYLPETHYQYGQVGISLVAIALEKTYNLPFSDILQQQLLNKLNMNETFINVPSTYTNIATGYNQENKQIPPFSVGNLTPAAGLKSSTYDLAKYLKLQLDSSQDFKLNKALAIVHKNYYCLYPDGTYQQLAWVYHPSSDLMSTFKASKRSAVNFKPQKLAQNCATDSNGFIEKSGNSYGMSLYIVYLPNKDSGVVVLTNRAQFADSVNLGRNILKKMSAL
jgi:beta-lactamase class C